MQKRTKIELHCHTKMSVGKGVIKPQELVKYACDNGYKAIAITDCGTVQAFPDAYQTWKDLWEKYRDECEQNGEEARQEDFLKVIYGLEGYMKIEGSDAGTKTIYPVLLYAQNETGIRNLYKIVTESYLKNFDKIPLISKDLIEEYREGILIGAVCDGGEVMSAVHTELGARSDEEYRQDLKNIMSFYDFVEVSPLGFGNGRDDRYIYHAMKNGGMLVAASDAYYLNEEDKIYWDILANGNSEYTERPRHLMNWDEVERPFGCWHVGMPDELKEVSAKVIENQSAIADQIEYLAPIREEKAYPVYPDADNTLRRICEERAMELFGEDMPGYIRERLTKELDAICSNGHASIYMMWRALVLKSLEKGCCVNSRGCIASSLVAYLCGITEINPLPKEYGGYDLPVEMFMGLDFDKEKLDIELNFASSIQEMIQDYVKEIPGVGKTYYAGSISTMFEKIARMHVKEYYIHNELPMPDEETISLQAKRLVGIKILDNRVVYSILALPEDVDVTTYTPLQHPWNSDTRVTTHFDVHSLKDCFLRMTIVRSSALDLIHELQEMTGVPYESIPMDDGKVLGSLCDEQLEEIEGLLDFGSKEERCIIRETGAKTYDDLIKVYGLVHGTNVWADNQREKLLDKEIILKDCIAFRDDVYMSLIDKGMDKREAYQIMESVRRGKGLTEEMIQNMKSVGISEWYIDVCKKIRYLFPRAHAVSYALLAWRAAYYKVHFPNEYEQALRAVA